MPVRRLVALAAVAAAAIALAPPALADHAGDVKAEHRGDHGFRWRDPNAGPVPLAAPAGAHLSYFGGRVVSNVQVVQVIWGTGSFLPQVTSTASPSIATFYQGVLNSPYVDWLTEYDTSVAGGTNQSIGRGSFFGQFVITPSVTAATITDAQIQSELAAQIAAGHLPAPTVDAAGNTNTYYAVFFPHGKTISQGGSSSCVAGGFCAYHGTVAANASHREFYYGVHPDMQAGSGCDRGCGTAPTTFQNQTSVSSHELVETMTDPEVGLATTFAPPLAWYDRVNGEIGDICNAQQGTVVGSDGVTYTVQTEFSNVANNCIVSRAPVANDFSIAVSPASQTVAPGASTTYTVTTAVTGGTAQTIALSATPPAGFTATFSPASVTAGGSSTLTVAVAAGTANQTVSFTVTGTAASGAHTATVTTVVSTTPPPANAIVNGGFETGSLSGWTATGVAGVSTASRSGAFAAQLGSTSPSLTSSIAQTFTAPAGSTQLTFFYRMTCPDTVTFDWVTATLRDLTTATTRTILPRTCATNAAYVQVTATLTAGHRYTLTLTNRDDNFAGDASFTLFDDVAVR
ncbi:MAG TPA: hypothetical protein VFP65_17335 [Anaeromyxobacteraceae bacterium]|nr:hypothetical protein [Anaeromyxobacteraceae bacterium]